MKRTRPAAPPPLERVERHATDADDVFERVTVVVHATDRRSRHLKGTAHRSMTVKNASVTDVLARIEIALFGAGGR